MLESFSEIIEKQHCVAKKHEAYESSMCNTQGRKV